MKSIILFIPLFVSVSCLDFGGDITTGNPTAEQVEWCRQTLHIREDVSLVPVGLRILASGIDDAMWFKFETQAEDITSVFDPDFIPSDSLMDRVSFHVPDDMPQWWDTGNRLFPGGTVELPGGKWITAGYRVESDGMICYIFWHET